MPTSKLRLEATQVYGEVMPDYAAQQADEYGELTPEELAAAQQYEAENHRDTRERTLGLPYFQTTRGLEYLAKARLLEAGKRPWEVTPELIRAAADELRAELQPPPLDLALNLTSAPSGGAPPVQFPALRISTNSSAIYPNEAMLGAWRAYFNGQLPRYFKFDLDLDHLVVVLTPLLTYQRGTYKLTLGSYRGRSSGFGPSIGFGEPLRVLTQVMLDPGILDHDARYRAAYDRIFGRRRVYSLPNGRWAIRLTDPLV